MGGEDPAKGSPKGSGSKGETAGFFLNCIEKYTPDTEYQERPLDKIYDAVIDGAVSLGTGVLGQVAGAAKDAAHLTKAERKAAKAARRGENAIHSGERTRMLGEHGTQVSSKTTWKHEGARLDVENPNQGQRAGQIHYQHGQEKYLYDPGTRSFVDAPAALNRRLQDPDFQKGIEKALKILGEK